MSFPEKLKQLRKDVGLSQAKLGKRLGVTRNAVSQWEAGATEPSTKHLRKLAAALGAPLDQLVESTPAYEDQIITAATRLFDRLGYVETSIEVLEGGHPRVLKV